MRRIEQWLLPIMIRFGGGVRRIKIGFWGEFRLGYE